MNPKLVSVIIPNYNYARFLKQRIDSILAQTYTNYEIIILDDCSSDNSKEIIEQYRSTPAVTQIVYNETNSGNTFKQWKLGIELAKGDLCYIAEADDLCDATLLAELVPLFDDDNITIAVCGYKTIDENGNISYQQESSNHLEIIDGKKFIREKMPFHSYIYNSGQLLFRRDRALSISREFMNPKYAGVGDRLFYINLALEGNVALLKKPLDLFRRHTSAQTLKREVDGSNIRARRFVYDYMKERKLLSFKMSRIVILYNRKKISENNDITPAKKKELLSLWKISYVERKLWGLYTRLFVK